MISRVFPCVLYETGRWSGTSALDEKRWMNLFSGGEGGDRPAALHGRVTFTCHVVDLSGQDGQVFSQVLTQPTAQGAQLIH